MALLTIALIFCFYAVTECTENEKYKVAAPSLIRLCNDFKHKPFFCLVCKGFDFSCFSSDGTTQSTPPPTPPSSTIASTTSSATTTPTTTTAMPE